MAETPPFGDGATAVFAFAAYHQLQSGQPVSKVVIDDGQGHRADPAGIQELASQGLAKADGNSLLFTDAGLAVLSRVIDAIRSAAAAR